MNVAFMIIEPAPAVKMAKALKSHAFS